MRRLLNAIQSTGTTIVIATHDLNLVDSWAEWVMVMHQGQVLMEADPETVFCQQQALERLGLGVPSRVEWMKAIAPTPNQFDVM